MSISVRSIAPVAHVPLILGMLRTREVAAIVDQCIPPHLENVIAGGRGMEAMVLAVLDGYHALYNVGQRLQERGMLPLLQGGVGAESLTDYRLGQMLDTLFAANLNRVCGALA